MSSNPPTTPSHTVSLAHGRILSVTGHQILTITDQTGFVELSITITDQGLSVRARAAALAVEAAGEIKLDCERFHLEARDGISFTSNGDLRASVAGDLDLRAGGHAHWEGASTRSRARRGAAQIEAHDDVRVDGERVLLNS